MGTWILKVVRWGMHSAAQPWWWPNVTVPVLLEHLLLYYSTIYSTMEAAPCFRSCSARAFASILLPNSLNHVGCPLFLFLFCSSICFYIIAQFTLPWRLPIVSVPVLLKHLLLHYCPIHSSMEAAPCFCSCSAQAFASILLPNSLFHGGCPLFLFLFCLSICFYIIAQFTLPWRLPPVSVPVLLKHLLLHYCPIHSTM